MHGIIKRSFKQYVLIDDPVMLRMECFFGIGSSPSWDFKSKCIICVYYMVDYMRERLCTLLLPLVQYWGLSTLGICHTRLYGFSDANVL